MITALNNYLISKGGKPINIGDKLYFDIECYKNYLLIKFRTVDGFDFDVEYRNENVHQPLDNFALAYICCNFLLIGYNSQNYDLILIKHVLSGKASLSSCKALSDEIINFNARYYNLTKKYSFNENVVIDSYDLIEVAPDPNRVSLKLYGARNFTPHLQDLPYDPDEILTPEMMDEVNYYCGLDLYNTQMLDEELKTEISLRYSMSKQFGMDLRSFSDAQIGERVIVHNIEQRTGRKVGKPKDYTGVNLTYTAPSYINFKSDYLNYVLECVNKAVYPIDKGGSPEIPELVKKLQISIGTTSYKIGIGGLHSQEEQQAIVCDSDHRLRDIDVESFYPNIILNNDYYPQDLGETFKLVYRHDLVEPRIENKAKAKNKDGTYTDEEVVVFVTLANSGKIVINGSYGKLGSKYAKIYAPAMMIAVCLTGQLSLLMLIERLEMNGIKVVSANTDGIVCYYHKDLDPLKQSIVAQWELDCNFKTEETNYHAIYSANVNNYIAIKSDESCQERKGSKRKGILADHWFTDPSSFKLKNTPDFIVCRNAVANFLMKDIPIEQTIDECNDIRQYISIRNVKGGGEFRGEYFGRVARFYISTKSKDCLRYRDTGNKVAKSDNAQLLMYMDGSFPDDVDKQFYVDYAYRLLQDVGYLKPNSQIEMF